MKISKEAIAEHSKTPKNDYIEVRWTRDNTRRRLKRMRAHRRRRR